MGGFHCFGCQDNNLEIAPPKERPPTTTAEPTAEALGLRLIPLVRGKPVFPLSVLQGRFSEGSFEQAEIVALQKDFEDEFGQGSGAAPGRDNRTAALCDYTIDEGLRPLDCTRVASLVSKPISELTGERPTGPLPK